MPSRLMLYVCHLVGFVLIMLGLWWLAENISGLPDYKLVAALAALTGLVVNHFRWWRLCCRVDNREIIQKVNHIIVSNYMVMLLLFVLMGFKN
ncbi:MAG: hypothetical protein JXR49_07835 [Acidobacteria bacterium]|nr:hypothetical protein [Acidobacteriota bacterium]